VKRASLTLLSREGVYVHAMEAGFLTYGSSYLPTPSQRMARQWHVLLAFVPVHSGASVRELHPLPASITYIAVHMNVAEHTIMLYSRCQAIFA
jgi:hypothetical protein